MNDPALKRLLNTASGQKKANRITLNKLRKLKSKNVDAAFHQAHGDVFANLDCLDCANCCKTTSPIFRDKDIERLAHYLKVKPSQFIEKYLIKDTDGLFMLHSTPCPFLGADNKCSVYDHRPGACREYPHTDRKNMHQILGLTLKNTLICPAVVQILEQVKRRTL